MKLIDPAIQSLATAKSLLLDPWGLTEADLARALGEIFAHKVDYADLYFQYTRSEGWSLEEGIVKTGSFSIGQGVGVRAISGEKTAFAYSTPYRRRPCCLRRAPCAVSRARERAVSRWPPTGRPRTAAAFTPTSTRWPRSAPPTRSPCSNASSAWRGRAIRMSFR